MSKSVVVGLAKHFSILQVPASTCIHQSTHACARVVSTQTSKTWPLLLPEVR